MVSPTPALNPISTGSEMKLATTPIRSTDATSSMPPTRQAKVPVAAISASLEPFGATWCKAEAVRMAIVEVVVTLSGRDEPITAYTTSGTNAV